MRGSAVAVWLAFVHAFATAAVPVVQHPASAVAPAPAAPPAAVPQPLRVAGRIGLLLPPDEPDRRALGRGAELALARHNATSAAPVELVVRGKPGQWGDDGDEAGRLVLDDEVRILIAPPGGAATHLALQVAGRTRVPIITLCPDGSVVGAGIPWVVRLTSSTANEVRALFGEGGTWLVYTTGDRAGREARNDIGQAAREAGAPVVCRLWAPAAEKPTVPSGVTGVLLWLPPPLAVEAARDLRAAGWKGVLAGPGSLRSMAFLRGAGPAARGFRVAAIDPGSEAAPALRAFAEAYQSKFGEPAEPAALLAADAVGLSLELLRRAGDEAPARLLPVPLAGDGLGRGLTGPWEFDRSGNRRLVLRVLAWTGDAWVPLGR